MKERTDPMHPSPRLRREHSRTAKLDIRLTPAEKQALAERAKHTGAPVCELVRSAVENLLGTGIDYRSAELLRIMGEIVQQNLLVSVQEERSINRELIEHFEREAARKASMVLERRRHLLEMMNGVPVRSLNLRRQTRQRNILYPKSVVPLNGKVWEA